MEIEGLGRASPTTPIAEPTERRLSRRELLRRATALGLSIPPAAALLAACGNGEATGEFSERLEGAPAAGANLASLGPFEHCTARLSVEDALDWQVPKAERPYRIAYMLISLQGYYFVASAFGAVNAAREAGVELEQVAAQGFADPGLQQQQLANLLQRGVDAVVVQPADVNGSVPLVRQALDEGVPLVVAGTLLNTTEAAQAVQDDYAIGQQMAEVVAQRLPQGGDGLILAGPAAATWSSNRTRGFMDKVSESFPNIRVAATPNQNFVDPTEGLRSFENAVQANPDISWLYAVDYNLLEAPSLPDRYRGRLVYVAMGLYGSSLQALEDDLVDTIIGIMPVFGATLGISRAVQLLNGETVPAITCYPAPIYTKDRLTAPETRFETFPPDFSP